MISRISGKLIDRKSNALIISVNGIGYEVIVPPCILQSLEPLAKDQEIDLVTYYYLQTEGMKAIPVLVGFRHEMEKEFFELFIGVTSIGPRSAVKALAMPIPRIAEAIERGDAQLLNSLPGVGNQKARDIIAKLQGKSGRFCLIREEGAEIVPLAEDIQAEALEVLLGLGHTRTEATRMIQEALSSDPPPTTVEELLNLAYRAKEG